jgi:hypothetical protein
MTVKNSFGKSFLLALAVFLALPAVALGQGNSRHGRNKDVFVNGHDARDGRYDGRGPRRDDNWRRRRDHDYDEDDRYRRDDDYRYRRDRGRYDNYGYGNNGYYGNYGYRDNFTQTALNAGYNAGIEQGRRDRSRGRYTDPRDSSAYRNADKDYNSRLGDRYTYQQYYRQGFINGYRDGLNGY